MSETLTPSEQAYFETGGEADPAAPAPRPAAPATATAPEPVERNDTRPDAPEPEAAAPPPEAERTRTVPHQALHAEREARKAAEARARQIEDVLARIGAALPKPAQPAAAEEAPIPDMQADPVGHILGRFAALEKRDSQMREWQQQQQQAVQQQRAVAELQQWGAAQEEDFAKERQDYKEATAFLLESRTAELRALGADPAQIRAQLQMDVVQAANTARQQGASFPQRVYDAAVARGYKAKGATAVEGAPPLMEAPDRINKGQAMATGVATTGAAPRGQMTAERLAEMNPREFERWMDKNPDDFDRIMGRYSN